MIATALAWLLGTCAVLVQPSLPGGAVVLLQCAAVAVLSIAVRRAVPLAFALGYIGGRILSR